MGILKGLLCIGLCLCLHVTASEKLILIGGSQVSYNPGAIKKFVEWEGPSGKTLRIPWASEEKPGTPVSAYDDAEPFPKDSVLEAPSRFDMPARRVDFMKMVGQANGIYFTGGDQRFVMAVLKDQELLTLLQSRFASGVVFGGTSAGLAIMSRLMFTGDGPEDDIDPNFPVLEEGLGLIRGVMLDQHFLKEKRENRLFSALLKGVEKLGVGVDEDSAVSVEDSRIMTVIGPKKVMVVDTVALPGKLAVEMLEPGQVYDLDRRELIAKP